MNTSIQFGQKFGKLTIVAEPRKEPLQCATRINYFWRVLCKCVCGREKDCSVSSLKRGDTTTCGFKGCRRKTHGDSYTRLYGKWHSMVERCKNERPGKFCYVTKGIKVCNEWLQYESFRDWAHASGYKDGLTLDRVDPDKGYSPDNCQWLTLSDNSKKVRLDRENKLLEYERRIYELEHENQTLLSALRDY